MSILSPATLYSVAGPRAEPAAASMDGFLSLTLFHSRPQATRQERPARGIAAVKTFWRALL